MISAFAKKCPLGAFFFFPFLSFFTVGGEESGEVTRSELQKNTFFEQRLLAVEEKYVV